MSAPKEILDLVRRFEQNADDYKSVRYNEAQLRQEFVNPFFKCLGWDIDNTRGASEKYKDVIHEAAIKIGGATKAPDYCFRFGGNPIFFLEAKKPAVNIKDDPAPAYQLRRYAWTAKLPLSVLTDFEEFAVYDTRVRPANTDKASAARIRYYTYKEYVDRWEDISAIFSKEAVDNGSFDKYAEAKKGKRGTATVDAAFLETIESWRDMLAKNLALRNPKLTQRELNYAVQVTIDRIIFLRMCEDRGIETDWQLQGLQNGAGIYGRLKQLFVKADERYNSGLFYFHKEPDRAEPPDELTPALKIDDRPLQEIIQGLYYPESPYEFSVLPAEILGHVYEQFLGKVIRLTAGHQARVEDKPEVKKAGGVYYTPTYIVNYIVKHTVGRLLPSVLKEGDGLREGEATLLPSPLMGEGHLLPSPSMGEGQGGGEQPPPTPHPNPPPQEGRGSMTPKQASKLRILDPACGSGSFLLGAYQYLLDWHRDWYLNDGPAQHTKELYQGPGGIWRLTTAEKKRILLNNIYGVDIDPQAVEVTKLSLLLKVLEGESKESLDSQLRFFHERALPDLASNIKCGNSLIGPDFYQGRQLEMFDEEERYRINVFDWGERFPKIMKAGGFDAVIGNPPYVRQESLAASKDYFEKHYEAFDGVADLYAYFMEKGVKLLRDGGLFSIIVSSSFLRATYGEPLRRTLKKYSAVVRLVDFGGLAVFANAKDTYVCIPLLAKGANQKAVEVSKVDSLQIQKLTEHVVANHFMIPHARLSPEAWSLKSDEEAAVFAKVIKAGKPLGAYVNRRLFYGIKTGLNEAFIIDGETKKALITKDKRSAELIKPLLGGEDIRRYLFHETGLWLIFTRRGVDINKYPAIREHLSQWKEDLTPKRDKSAKRGRKPGSYQWYEIQDDVAYYEAFDAPKLIFPDIAKGPRFCLDTDGHYLTNTAYCLGTDDLYLLGVLNSRLFWFAISNISIPFGIRAGQYRYRLIYQYMEKVPIRVIDDNNASDKLERDRIVDLVAQTLALHRQLAAAKTPHEKTALQNQIDATDRQIDRLVYELYGLTDEEIRIVEDTQ
jgi:type I restriction-modification system DNA methylase subunit